LKILITKKGPEEWLKEKAPSSSPRQGKKNLETKINMASS
jgi:hypothetical protein